MPSYQGRLGTNTGEALGAPTIHPLKTFPVEIVEGRI
jgi:hypothetical protein